MSFERTIVDGYDAACRALGEKKGSCTSGGTACTFSCTLLFSPSRPAGLLAVDGAKLLIIRSYRTPISVKPSIHAGFETDMSIKNACTLLAHSARCPCAIPAPFVSSGQRVRTR